MIVPLVQGKVGRSNEESQGLETLIGWTRKESYWERHQWIEKLIPLKLDEGKKRGRPWLEGVNLNHDWVKKRKGCPILEGKDGNGLERSYKLKMK